MSSLTEKLSVLAGRAFEAAGLPAHLGRVVASSHSELSQFQCNGAMAAAKAAKKNPRVVAEDIAAKLKENPVFAGVDIAGPGFINLRITDDYLADHLRSVAADRRFGVPAVAADTVVLDYGGPNIAKPMHVGHLRAAIIGDSLRRVMAFAGYKTLGDVHMGDWGTHMGMIVSEHLKNGQAERIAGVDLNDEAAVAALMNELSDLYPKVSAACKEDEVRKAEALKATLEIQNREPAHYRLWQVIRDASMRGMKANYERLGVHFDLWKGEADVHDLIAPMVADLKARHLAVEDDGALIVPVKRDDDKKEMPPLILYKRDGAVMYGTTDLATIVERMDLYGPVKIIYIVDQRQHLHFEQVFRAARMAAIVPEDVELTHAGFGTMNGTDGKPFKTRAGGVMKLEDLIEMGLEKARERLAEAELAKDFSPAEREDIAHKVAIAAIKFADLQNQRQADYIFDINRLTSFEGKTGPYLLYQTVRINSLLHKAGISESRNLGISEIPGFRDSEILITDTDRPLALLLTEMPDAFAASLAHYMPHHLCDYAYRLAQAFSSFYASCHILSEENADLRASRLFLCHLTHRTLETVLGLLGISVPEKM